MQDADLPPLPPPLPPAHSRSYSSSSSSSAGSPLPPPVEWPRSSVADASLRGARETVQLASVAPAVKSSPGAERAARAAGSYQDTPHAIETATFDRDHRLSQSTLSNPSPRTRFPPATISTHATLDPASAQSQAGQRSPASNLLSRVSPSLSSHSRYSAQHSNVANLGLRGSPEPLGLGFGTDTFSRRLGAGLPSPPATNSDGGSMEEGKWHGSNDFVPPIDGIDDEDGATDSGIPSSSKPERPPKSLRRSTGTPTIDGSGSPVSERCSPIAKRSVPPPERDGLISDTDRAKPERKTSPSPASSIMSSASSRSLSKYATAQCSSDDMEELRDSLVGAGSGRRFRARTASAGRGDSSIVDEQNKLRPNGLREKNQRILDSINSQQQSLASPPESERARSRQSALDYSAGRQTVQRSSTSSTIRKLATGYDDDDLLQGTMPEYAARGGSTDDDDEPVHRSFDFAMQSSARDLAEFGAAPDGLVRRSATLGDISAHDRDYEKRASTAGSRTRSRASFGRQALDKHESILPDRSATSMSSYPSTIDRIRARRSELVGSDRTRAASSFSDTRQHDREISESMRRLASRELLRTPRDRSTSQPFHSASPSSLNANTASPSVATGRPALPTEFRERPSTSAENSRITSRRSLEPKSSRPTTASSASNLERSSQSRIDRFQIPNSESFASLHNSRQQARSEISLNDDDYSRGIEAEDERERTPKSARKVADGRTGSARRASTSLSTAERRADSVSESFVDRAYSRISRDERRSGPRSPTASSYGRITPPMPSSSGLGGSRNGDSELSASARRERFQKSEVGSDAWMAELDDLRQRGAHSRASGDARSTGADHPFRSPSTIERDRTVKAINALLAGQGIVASPIGTSSPAEALATGSPRRKRESIGTYDRNRKISFANGTHEDSRLPPGSNSMSRSNSNTSRAGSETALSGPISPSSADADHHKLLLSAFDQLDRHFSQSRVETSETVELVKRAIPLISSTTRLNSGLRALVDDIKQEHVQAQLDEEQRIATLPFAQFEKHAKALLRSSDDQVRSLSETLLAFTRVDRERERSRKDSDPVSRPVSRAGIPPLVQQSPTRRPTISSPADNVTVSLTSSRSPVILREVLRNPLEEPSEPGSIRRSTARLSSRSSSVAADSPSPASRRAETSYETPSRRQSISTSSTFSTGTGSGTATRLSTRRAKLSDPSRSPTLVGAAPFQSQQSSATIPKVDSTQAISNDSPTRLLPFPTRPLVEGSSRTYSGASGDAIAYEALELAANLDETRTRQERAAALERLETTTRSDSPTESRLSFVSTPTSESRRPRTRSSMGAIGTALKNAFTPKKKGQDASPSPAGIGSSQFQFTGAKSVNSRDINDSGSVLDERRFERRKEVENILRRSTSRT
ncbi:uncharacterized protein JCM15063_004632 [Sporobolomyces koalae]|uniref:uncharacterized protein n=1 Tax=Sporobolomyces koalae TaxID=500713 RepID=UPI00316F6375